MKKQPITLKADGTWWHGDGEVTHKRTIELFNKSVIYKKGKYFLTGEKKPVPIVVEDVAYFVKSVKKEKDGYLLKLSNGETEKLDLKSLDISEQNIPYCLIANGAPARFSRKAHNEIMKDLKKKQGYLGLVVNSVFYPLQKDGKKSASQNAKPKKKVSAKKKAVKKTSKKKLVKKKSTKKKKAKASKKSVKKSVKKKKVSKSKKATSQKNSSKKKPQKVKKKKR